MGSAEHRGLGCEFNERINLFCGIGVVLPLVMPFGLKVRAASVCAGVFTLSLFPVFRFTAIHSKAMDTYFNYSLAGPAFISRSTIDGRETGRKFTFFDYMGIGAFFGKDRRLNTEIDIMHFSNDNIYPVNAGLKIPLTFSLGYTF